MAADGRIETTWAGRELPQLLSLWANLPPDLLMAHVLLSLPLPKIFEFRIVCKSWASHLSSPTFLQTWSAHTARQHEVSCLVMAPHFLDWSDEPDKTLVAYFPSLCRYVGLPFCPILPFLDSGRNLQTRHMRFRCMSFKAMASAGGLICTIVTNYTVIVFNPLNGSIKMLPMTLRPRSTHKLSTHMIADLNLLSYKVFLLGKDAYRFGLKVYDSLQGSWTSIDPPSFSAYIANDTAHADIHFWDNTRKTIYGYHAYANRWSKVLFNTEGKGLFSWDDRPWFANFESPCIMAYNGRFIFALIIWKTHLAGFIVYELQVSKSGSPLHWKKIAQTPQQMLEEDHSYRESMPICCNKRVTLVHNQKFICMMYVCTKSNTPEFKASKRPRGVHAKPSAQQLLNPIAYDIESDKWEYIPSYKGGHDMAALFSCNLAFDTFP